MVLKNFSLNQFRNIQTASMELSSGCNWLTGDNGAGKTAILESLDVLSRGRTFRTHYVKPLIQEGKTEYQVQATTRQGKVVSVKKTLRQTEVKINGETIRQRRETAKLLPIQVLHPESHRLLNGGKKKQQAFLDWGVFHVKPSSVQNWMAYHKALKQRNALLKGTASRKTIEAWDVQTTQYANALNDERYKHFDEVRRRLRDIDEVFGDALALRYWRGWDADIDIAEVWSRRFADDSSRKYTQDGPHRAGIEISLNGAAADKQASRGQQKLILAVLMIAQITLLAEKTGEACLFLIDDLCAELDFPNQQKLINLLKKHRIQALLTITEDIDKQTLDETDRLFHVKQGEVFCPA